MRHLFKAEEILGLHLASVHNVHFMIRLMQDIRSAILAGTFAQFRQRFLTEFHISNQEVRHAQLEARRERKRT